MCVRSWFEKWVSIGVVVAEAGGDESASAVDRELPRALSNMIHGSLIAEALPSRLSPFPLTGAVACDVMVVHAIGTRTSSVEQVEAVASGKTQGRSVKQANLEATKFCGTRDLRLTCACVCRVAVTINTVTVTVSELTRPRFQGSWTASITIIRTGSYEAGAPTTPSALSPTPILTRI